MNQSRQQQQLSYGQFGSDLGGQNRQDQDPSACYMPNNPPLNYFPNDLDLDTTVPDFLSCDVEEVRRFILH